MNPPFNVNPAETQFLQAERYSLEEVARAFGVPLSLINTPSIAPRATSEKK